jgi:hypothetical protein
VVCSVRFRLLKARPAVLECCSGVNRPSYRSALLTPRQAVQISLLDESACCRIILLKFDRSMP